MDKRYTAMIVLMNVLLGIFTFFMYQNAAGIQEMRGLAYSDCENYMCRSLWIQSSMGDNITMNRTIDCSGATEIPTTKVMNISHS